MLLIALLLLAPSPAGRLLLDVVGGITLLLVLLPLGAGVLGWIGWVLIQRRMRTCPACGFRSLGSEVCPACGTVFATESPSGPSVGSEAVNPHFDARDVTIDVKATDVDAD